MTKAKLTVRMPTELLKALEYEARRTGQTKNGLILQKLWETIQPAKKKPA